MSETKQQHTHTQNNRNSRRINAAGKKEIMRGWKTEKKEMGVGGMRFFFFDVWLWCEQIQANMIQKLFNGILFWLLLMLWYNGSTQQRAYVCTRSISSCIWCFIWFSLPFASISLFYSRYEIYCTRNFVRRTKYKICFGLVVYLISRVQFWLLLHVVMKHLKIKEKNTQNASCIYVYCDFFFHSCSSLFCCCWRRHLILSFSHSWLLHANTLCVIFISY